MEITNVEYWKQIESIAVDLVDECKHDDLDEIDQEELYERTHETIDGHQWIIYYSYNDWVIRYCSNSEAWLDCYAPEDIGRVVDREGMTGARAVQAFFAMLEDVNNAVYELVEARGLEIT